MDLIHQTTKIHFIEIPNELQPVVKGTADSCIVKMNEITFSIFKDEELDEWRAPVFFTYKVNGIQFLAVMGIYLFATNCLMYPTINVLSIECSKDFKDFLKEELNNSLVELNNK